MWGCSMCTLPFSAPRDDMLTMLVCANRWLSTHLYTLAYIHAWVLLASVSSMLQHNEAMDIRSKPTFVPYGHHPCLFAILLCFPFLLASWFLCLPCLSCLSTLCLFIMLFASFPSMASLSVSCLFLCMYAHGARMHGATAQSPRCKQKGQGYEHVDISQVAAISRFSSLAFPFCYVLFWTPSFLFPFSFRWFVLGESSKTCTKHLWTFRPPKIQLNQFKQYVKQLVCGNLTYAIIWNWLKTI